MSVNPNPNPTGGTNLGHIKAGLQTASSIFGYIGAKNQQKRQFAQDDKSAKEAYERNLEQWHRANAYNDPSQQMARLKAAGLNPNLIYGSGGGATQAAPSPTKEAPKAKYSQPPLNMAGGISEYMQVAMQNAQIKSIQENTEAVRIDNEKRKIQVENITSYKQNPDGSTTVTVTKQNRYRLKLDIEQKQKELNVSNSQINNQIQQIKHALNKYNIQITDPIILRQMALNLQHGNLSEVTKRQLLTAAGALLEAKDTLSKMR